MHALRASICFASSVPRREQVEDAEHDGEQVVEIVGDAAGQLADRLHLLRLEQGGARLLQRLLRVASAR